MLQAYLNKRPLYLLFAITIVIALYTILNREIGLDDAWLGEQAYWFSQKGYAISELLSGLSGFDERHLTYHRLHIWQGALAYLLFGWSAITLKSISLVYMLLFIASSYLFIKRNQILEYKTDYLLFYILILSHALTVKMSFTYRPDVPIMALGFLSFYLLYSALKEKNTLKVLLSGVLAGACALAHLNGVVFMFAGGVVLLLTKNYRLCIYFSVTSALVAAIYLAEMHSKELLDIFLFQFTNSPALSDKDFSLSGSLMKFLTSHRTYFHKGSDAIYTLLFIFVMWTQRQIIFKDEKLRIIFIYFVAIAFCLAVISPGGKSVYLIYHAPYAFLLVAALSRSFLAQSVARQRTFATLLTLFVIIQWAESFALLPKENVNLPAIHYEIASELKMQKGERIVAPMEFVFNEVANYKIQSFLAYRLRDFKGFIKIEDFFKLAAEDKRKFLILQKQDLDYLGMSVPEKGQEVENYQYLGQRAFYYVFQFTS